MVDEKGGLLVFKNFLKQRQKLVETFLYIYTQINNIITKGLLANLRQRCQKLVTDQTV